MAPFDFNYVHDDGLNGPTLRAPAPQQNRHVAAPHPLPAPLVAPAAAPQPRLYPLAEDAPLRPLQWRTDQVHSEDAGVSMRTPSYLEYILQVLDKNATLTSIIFICAYAELLRSL